MKALYIDTETTGLTSAHGIIQIAAIAVIDGVEQEPFVQQVQPFPEDILDEYALKVNNTTKEQIATYESPHNVHGNFCDYLGKWVNPMDNRDKFHFLAYNSTFDSEMMRAFFSKCGDRYFGSWFWNPDICVMRMAALALAGQRKHMENFKLATVARQLGIEFKDEALHDALTDIRLTREVYRRIAQHWNEIELTANRSAVSASMEANPV